MKKAGSSQNIKNLFISAVTKLQQGDARGARAGLEKVVQKAPDSAAARYNLGLTYQHLNMHSKAIREYRKAVRFDPSNVDALVNLALSYKELEEVVKTADVIQKALELNPNHPRALNLLGVLQGQRNEVSAAIQSFEQALGQNPQDADARQNLASLLIKQKQYQKALDLIKPVVEQAPTWQSLEVYCYGLIYLERYDEAQQVMQQLKQSLTEALQDDFDLIELSFAESLKDHFGVVDAARKLLDRDADKPEVWNTIGNAYFQLDAIALAIGSYENAVRLDSSHPEYQNNLGLSYASKGEKDKAEERYRNAIALRPDYAEAYRNLIAMQKYNDLESDEYRRLVELYASAETEDENKTKIAFALGKIYDDCKQYDQAFAAYDDGNKLKSKQISMDFDKYFGHIDRIADLFDFVPKVSVEPLTGVAQPVFILGMPRSGTTLVEQIISRHRDVTACGELPCIERAIARLEKKAGKMRVYPDDFLALSLSELQLETEGYAEWVHRLHDIPTPFFTDKMPFNFVHVWLIRALFPRAAIVHCHRHPLDVITSNYFQLYGSEVNFVYDLKILANYYIRYFRMMKQWHQVFAGDITQINYEELVADFAPQARKLIYKIGLDWDENCLQQKTKSDAAVRTASIWQVRQGIYQSSSARWLRYKDNLQPAIEVLQDAGILDDECHSLY